MSQAFENANLNQAQTCPLCQGVNQCAVILGGEISDCWCATKVFPPLSELQTKIQALKLSHILPLESSACICQNCLARLQKVWTEQVDKETEKQSPSLNEDGLFYEVK
ncbi:cysteine-rich CWC family protein [Shewanella sp. A25]|nr:cysteine-rich CWC family protein [Shewanella shenzhenensis]